MEAEEISRHLLNPKAPGEKLDTLRGDLFGDPRMRRRWIKNNLWYRPPTLSRPFLFFFYSYFVRLGFLDGRAGLVHHVLSSFWFRFLINAKLLEKQRTEGDVAKMIVKIQSDLDSAR